MKLPRWLRIGGYKRWPGDPPGPGLMAPGKSRKIKVTITHESIPAPLCDACHATHATYAAHHFGMVLSLHFCTHHYRKYKEALEAKGWEFGEIK
jgi:hypothetical protein